MAVGTAYANPATYPNLANPPSNPRSPGLVAALSLPGQCHHAILETGAKKLAYGFTSFSAPALVQPSKSTDWQKPKDSQLWVFGAPRNITASKPLRQAEPVADMAQGGYGTSLRQTDKRFYCELLPSFTPTLISPLLCYV